MRKYGFFLLVTTAALFADAASAASDDKLALNVAVADSDYVFFAPEPLSVTATLENANAWDVKGDLVVTITTDDYRFVRSDTAPVTAKAGKNVSKTFDYRHPAPGFYRYAVQFVRNGNDLEETFNLGFEPEKINSPLDAHADFQAFWANSLKELAEVAPPLQDDAAARSL